MNQRIIGPEDLSKGLEVTFTNETGSTLTGVIQAFEFNGGETPAFNWVQLVDADTYNPHRMPYGVSGAYIYGMNKGWTITVEEPSPLEIFGGWPFGTVFQLNSADTKRVKIGDDLYLIEGFPTERYSASFHLYDAAKIKVWED